MRPLGAFAGPVAHVYVHVPFCRAKCDYCDFASTAVGAPGVGADTAGLAARLDAYAAGVAAEWERERSAHGVRGLRTLYVGGGTPSLLGPDRLESLFEPFRPHLTPAAEVTVEANPEDVDDGFATWAAGAGRGGAPGEGRRRERVPSRVSLGVQSFAARLRAGLGRRTSADPADACARLRAAGLENLSLDLMFGLPGQSLVDLEDDLAAVLALRPEHVSWYELAVVRGTPLGRRPVTSEGPAGDRVIADIEQRASMYRRIVRVLRRAGYDWYEVSSFALPGRRARHNVAYWRARPYIGLGPAAVSSVEWRRWTNATDDAAWRASLAAGAPPPREIENLDISVLAHERLMLAARCGAPVRLSELAGVLDTAAAATLAEAGLVSLGDGTIRVTRKGRYVADEVCVRLFRD